MTQKQVTFLVDALDTVRAFPEGARQQAGYQLDKVQKGRMPDDWKPMPSIGAGVNEIRLRDDGNAYRVIYVAKLEDAVYVLHAFQKKTQQTSKRDIELARTRYKELMRR